MNGGIRSFEAVDQELFLVGVAAAIVINVISQGFDRLVAGFFPARVPTDAVCNDHDFVFFIIEERILIGLTNESYVRFSKDHKASLPSHFSWVD